MVSTPEGMAKYMIDVDDWEMAVRAQPPQLGINMFETGATRLHSWDSYLQIRLSGLLVAYPPLPGVPLKK